MKTIALTSFLFITGVAQAQTSDIVLSKKINSVLSKNIEKDLKLIENFKYLKEPEAETLTAMGIDQLNSESTSSWLKERVHYIIEEKAFSVFNLFFKRVIFVERKNVQFPESEILPYSSSLNMIDKMDEQNIDHQVTNVKAGLTVMSNIGSSLYISGKQKEEVYGLKVSRGFLRPSIKVEINSPRSGIIQIGEGLFSPELIINQENPSALSNSIFRIGTFFHEARHSDGHGKSLGFTHAICPAGHDYEGAPACDENLNGPYTIGRLMITEMSKNCDESSCNESEKEMLRLLIIDNASRVMTKTHTNEDATNWDAHPESI